MIDALVNDAVCRQTVYSKRATPASSYSDTEGKSSSLMMRLNLKVMSCAAGLVALVSAAGAAAAAGAKPVNLKAGEAVDIDNVYWVAKCKSLLRGKPVADILEGPSDVTVSIRDEKVTPRSGGCTQPIEGGVLVLKAPKDVKAKTEAKVTIRIKYPTSDGERQGTRVVNLTLFP